MRVNGSLKRAIRRRRLGLASEQGFTMVIALGVLVITSLLAAGTFAAVQADAPLAQQDLNSKRAYYAARAGVNRFLYELNQNPNHWQTCFPEGATKRPIAPGANESYTYHPLPAVNNGATACSPSPPASGDPISTMIDHITGTFQVRFTGYAGPAGAEVKRGLIATFRKDTPLDYLWYTIYETLDPVTYPTPWANTYDQCNKWERPGAGGARPSYCRDIQFISGDRLNGPTYTQDQYLISGTPTFGRLGKNDKTESSVPSLDANSVCMHWDTEGASACLDGTFHGTRAPSAPVISPPPNNDQLLTDATRYGCGASGCGTGNPPGVQTGITSIVLNNDQMQITNCQVTCGPVQNVTINRFPLGTPIVYVKNASGCNPAYSPYNPTYPTTGACGTVYVRGTYTRSVTIAAQSDIIIDGPISKGAAAPAPVLGLIANNFVRVKHPLVGTRPAGADSGDCPTSGNTEASGSMENLEIDAAILAVQHSFIVDNYDCGQHSNLDDLIITGAIAQYYRGTVGTGGGGGASTGYLKDYNYDDRFAVAQPPYLFNIASASWHVARETLCVPGGTASTTKCEPQT
jgi:hypothetical protein